MSRSNFPTRSRCAITARIGSYATPRTARCKCMAQSDTRGINRSSTSSAIIGAIASLKDRRRSRCGASRNTCSDFSRTESKPKNEALACETNMSSTDFAARLQAAIARHVGVPGTIHDLQRLTGGANKTTWSFDADVSGARAEFILQLASPRANDESNPLAGVSPHLIADEDARLMIAAVK